MGFPDKGRGIAVNEGRGSIIVFLPLVEIAADCVRDTALVERAVSMLASRLCRLYSWFGACGVGIGGRHFDAL